MRPGGIEPPSPVPKTDTLSVELWALVPQRGLEPPHLTVYAPKAYVYTNFTTAAIAYFINILLKYWLTSSP